MTDSLRNKITRWSVLILFIIVVGYGIFRIYPFLLGPSITLYAPQNGDEVGASTFEVSGKVIRAKEIRLQGRPITIDTDGVFKETLVTHAPYTILVLEAEDAYGKKEQVELRVSPKKEIKTVPEVEQSQVEIISN